MVYIRNNPGDTGKVSRKPAETGKGKYSQARVLYGAEQRSIDSTSELEHVNDLLPLGISVVRDCMC